MHYILSLLNFFFHIMTINGKENRKEDHNQNQDKLKCEVTDLHVAILIQIFFSQVDYNELIVQLRYKDITICKKEPKDRSYKLHTFMDAYCIVQKISDLTITLFNIFNPSLQIKLYQFGL